MGDSAAGRRRVVYQLRRTPPRALEGILIINQYVILYVRKLTCATLDAARALRAKVAAKDYVACSRLGSPAAARRSHSRRRARDCHGSACHASIARLRSSPQ